MEVCHRQLDTFSGVALGSSKFFQILGHKIHKFPRKSVAKTHPTWKLRRKNRQACILQVWNLLSLQLSLITPSKTNMEPKNLVVWVDVSPFPKVYFQVPTVFKGVSVTAGDFFGGLTECQTIKQLNWSGQSPTLWISCRRTPWCPLESCGLVTGEISRKKVFWSWEVGCVVFSHRSFWGECWKSCLSLLRDELELQGMFSQHWRFLFFLVSLWGQDQHNIGRCQNSKEVFQWWVKIVDFTRFSTFNFPVFVATWSTLLRLRWVKSGVVELVSEFHAEKDKLIYHSMVGLFVHTENKIFHLLTGGVSE